MLPRKGLLCILELHIRTITCPGVILKLKDDLYISACVFGQYKKTSCVPAVFPLTFDEKLVFEKVYTDVIDPGDIVELFECRFFVREEDTVTICILDVVNSDELSLEMIFDPSVLESSVVPPVKKAKVKKKKHLEEQHSTSWSVVEKVKGMSHLRIPLVQLLSPVTPVQTQQQPAITPVPVEVWPSVPVMSDFAQSLLHICDISPGVGTYLFGSGSKLSLVQGEFLGSGYANSSEHGLDSESCLVDSDVGLDDDTPVDKVEEGLEPSLSEDLRLYAQLILKITKKLVIHLIT
uniref:Uncharacterized protein n=1 Tax=Sphaerodactylus townsendi TaxID=933632 RepID=A0ACB8F4V0_9SAUR